MDMSNQALLSARVGSKRPIEDCVADASQQEAWRLAATRDLLEDLRGSFQGRGSVPPIPLPAAAGSPGLAPFDIAAMRADIEMFLAGPGRKKSGERQRQILAGFVDMLEKRKEARITTSALAKYLDLSEAALYRHFDSKSQMLDTLIAFIENSVFEQVDQVNTRLAGQTVDVHKHTALLVEMLLKFAESNPGVSRVMAGDALVMEEEFLRLRMAQFFSKFEDVLAGVLRGENSFETSPADGPAVLASALSAFCIGRLLRFARSGFASLPSSQLDECLATMLR